MNPTLLTVSILLTGILVVILGVLLLRLHAFLALTLGALIVSLLTPRESVTEHALNQASVPINSVTDDDRIQFHWSGADDLPIGSRLYLLSDERPMQPVGTLEVIEKTQVKKGDKNYYEVTAAVAESESKPEMEPGQLVIRPVHWTAAQSAGKQTVGARVAAGFGSTAGKIGILIAMAAIIGKCLLDSGAADRIVRSTLRLMGERGAPLAFLLSGFLLAVPVFFDTVFYLLIPLGKAMRARTGRNYLMYVLAIVAGATMAHSLVPPTPGPLFVAEELGVSLGVMILVGFAVGLFTAGFGYVYLMLASRVWDLPLRESPDLSLAELERVANRPDDELPLLWLSLLPILLPVVLIGGYTVLDSLGALKDQTLLSVAKTLGDKNIALVISAVIAMWMLVWQKRISRSELAESIGSALASGGVIILITSAGGAFGAVLQQTGVANLIQDLPETGSLVILCLGWLITAAIRTAQGSATVAMITAVGVMAAFGDAETLGCHPVWLALAIGCGSKPIAWMNDSGFWVITKMSGMTETEGLKYVTPMTTSMGIVGLGIVLAGAALFPSF